ncbi:MAG: hypothetical protein KAW66_13530, partial [Candidatus Lokiarchaeota archaeon]|nr:hypothetical protein [Candidatus Lokiarchaeota archaeon]
ELWENNRSFVEKKTPSKWQIIPRSTVSRVSSLNKKEWFLSKKVSPLSENGKSSRKFQYKYYQIVLFTLQANYIL